MVTHNNFDITSFDLIGIKEAYFLGLLCADGCLHNSSNRYMLSFGSCDKDIVVNLVNFFRSNNKISIYTYGNNKEHFRTSFCSEHLFKRLCTLGCIPNKSRTLNMPNIPESFYLPFILGLFDGDGSLSCNTSINSWKTCIGTASEHFIDWLSYVFNTYNIIYSLENRKIKNGLFYSIVTTGQSAKYFLTLLYNSIKKEVIPMERKYLKYLELCNISFNRGPAFQQWELAYLKDSSLSHEMCSNIISIDNRNFGWIRSIDTIRHRRSALCRADLIC